jgi:hypothetical protein
MEDACAKTAVKRRSEFMVGKAALGMLAACALSLGSGADAHAQATANPPPYAILLRSRNAAVAPERTKHGETGGGFIQVTQILPNVAMFLMPGAVVAGEDHGGRAALQFHLEQDLEIVASREGLRPPRLVVTAWLIGSLHSSLRHGGTAEQAAACATIRAAGQPIIDLCMKPHGVGSGENLLVNDRIGPLESPAVPGTYCLSQTLRLSAVQDRTCYAGAAAAFFDPDPRLDSRWNEVLKPFRAVPRQNFGFRVIIRVVEDVAPVGAESQPPAEPLPPPQLLPQAQQQKPPSAHDAENSGR